MQLLVISLLVLAMCELPVFRAKKVVLVMPRAMRRSPASPWRHLIMMHAQKNRFQEHGFPGPRPGYSPGPRLHHPKNLHFAKDPYPQGGDDFDQGNEEVNNVIVPHGKGITHAVSFGKGYIPFETFKDHRASNSHHDYRSQGSAAQDGRYGPPRNYPSGPSYAKAHISQQADAYFAKQGQGELQDRIQDRGAQKLTLGKPLYGSPNAGAIGSQYGVVPAGVHSGKAGVSSPSGYSQASSSSNKQGIVLRDSIVLDDYRRKLAELTKNWPSSFSGGSFATGAIGTDPRLQDPLQQYGLSRQFDGNNGLQGLSAGTSPLINLGSDQGQKGYAVKEDVVDTPHDFRNMPIQTAPPQQPPSPLQRIIFQQQQQQQQQSPVQSILQSQQPVQSVPQHQQPVQSIILHEQPAQPILQLQQPVQNILQQRQPHEQIVHQQPVPQTAQLILPQSQIPVNYALSDYQDYVHG